MTVLDFDELRTDPQGFAEVICKALDVEPLTLDEDLHRPVRSASTPRSVAAGRGGKQLAVGLRAVRAERLLGRLKSSALVERMLFRPIPDDERPRPTDEDLVYLAERLAGDALALDDLLGTSYHERWW